jgi:chromosome partitioning protein
LLLDLVDYKLLASTLAGQQSDLILTRWIAEGRAGKSPECDLSPYDLILIDCPPSKNRLTRAALLASDYVISPVNFEHFSTKALSYLSFVLKDMQDCYGRCPELMVLGNAHDPQRVRSSVHIAVIAQQYGNALLETTIRRSEDFPKSLDEDPKLPLLLSRPTSPAADDVREVARSISDRMGLFDRKFAKDSEVSNA